VRFLVLFSVLISAVLPISFAYADFLEDISSIPTERALNTILDYCKSNPDGNISNDVVKPGNISEFYTGYTCDRAVQDKAWFEGNNSISSLTLEDFNP
jgi:hypothetical protein